jgi:hypothetical protein
VTDDFKIGVSAPCGRDGTEFYVTITIENFVTHRSPMVNHWDIAWNLFKICKDRGPSCISSWDDCIMEALL